jgi:hypothetical protein
VGERERRGARRRGRAGATARQEGGRWRSKREEEFAAIRWLWVAPARWRRAAIVLVLRFFLQCAPARVTRYGDSDKEEDDTGGTDLSVSDATTTPLTIAGPTCHWAWEINSTTILTE